MSGERALRLVAAVPDTGSGLLDEWADWLRAAGSADRTITTRISNIKILCGHAGVDDPVAVSTRQIVRWLSDCRTQWTRHTYATSARAWFAWLVARGYRDDNPAEEIPKPRAPRGVPRPVSSQALADALEVAPRKARAYISLAAYAGLRVHEIAKVRGEDFTDGWLFVTGKGDKPAALPVHPVLEQLRRGWPEQGWWFPSFKVDGPVKPETVSSSIVATFEKAGHSGITAHQLRHWYGTWLQRTTKDIRVTQELMRHASLASTQIYTEVSSDAKIQAVRRLEL